MQCISVFCEFLIIIREFLPKRMILVMDSQYIYCEAGTEF
jgi:hypothetical protein